MAVNDSSLYPNVSHFDLKYNQCSQSSCSFSSWYFSIFSCSFFLMLLSATIASLTTAVFFSLSTTSMSGSLANSCLSVWTLKSHRTYAITFMVSHWELGTSKTHAPQMFLYTISVTWLCLPVCGKSNIEN